MPGEEKTADRTNRSSIRSRAPKYDDEVPPNAIARYWCRLYRAVPKVKIPSTHLEIGFVLVSTAFLWLTRITIYQISIHFFGWPRDDPGAHEAVGSIVAIFHSTNLLPGLWIAMTTQPYRPSEHMSSSPRWWQELVNALLQFCTGYMIYDSITSFLIFKGLTNLVTTDFLFLGHHFATSLYMTQARVLQAGHFSAMICMFLGEVTNPFMNSFYVAQRALEFDCCNGTKMRKFHNTVAMAFAYSYFSMRAIVAPIFFLHLTGDLLFSKTRKNIPLIVRCLWIFMIWAVALGSYDWIMECWLMIKEKKGLLEKEMLTERIQERGTSASTSEL